MNEMRNVKRNQNANGCLYFCCFFFFVSQLQAERLILDAESTGLQGLSQKSIQVPYLCPPIKGKDGIDWGASVEAWNDLKPEIDGLIEEDIWQEAAVISNWYEYPSRIRSDHQAEMRLLADRFHLYIAMTVKLKDMQSESIVKPKGGDEYQGSLIDIFFDPNKLGHEKYQIAANPLGMTYDAHNGNKVWKGKGKRMPRWKSKGRVQGDGWTIEMVIPTDNFGKYAMLSGSSIHANFCWVDDKNRSYSWTGQWGAPRSDYGEVILGSIHQNVQTKPSVEFLLDRDIYDPRDLTAQAYVQLEPLSLAKATMSLHLSLKDKKGKVYKEDSLYQIPSLSMGMTTNLQDIPTGEYIFELALKQNDQTLITTDKAFSIQERKILAQGQNVGRIPITLHPNQKGKGVSWPINIGVPFAQDSLYAIDNVRLKDPKGREVPIQTSCRSRWSKYGSIQWLGLDFKPILSDQPQVYHLEYSPRIRRKAIQALSCEEEGDHLVIDTGKIKLKVNRKKFRLIDEAWFDANQDGQYDTREKVISTQHQGGLFLIDHEGQSYNAAYDRGVQVNIEEIGPVKVVLKVMGWYVKKGSPGRRISCELPTDKLGKFTLRLTAYANEAYVQVALTSVMTHDTNKVHLKGLGLSLPFSDTKSIQLGLEDQTLNWDSKRLRGKPYLLQHRWDRSIDDQSVERKRAMGWIRLEGQKANALISIRNMWKRYPKEIEWKKGHLNLHVWPAHGKKTFSLKEQLSDQNIYKLLYAHQGELLDFRFPEQYTKSLDQRLKLKPKSFGNYYEAMEWSNGQGVGIHNDFLIYFQAKDAKETLPGNAIQDLCDTIPHASPDPKYICQTGIFGPLLHVDPKNKALEERYRRGFNALKKRTLVNDEYGAFIFNNTHTYWRYQGEKSHAGFHRVWQNCHYMIQQYPLVQYMRSGDPEWMSWTRDHIDTVRETAIVHYHSDERRFRYHTTGAMYHCKGFAPWAGDSGIAYHMAIYTFLAYDFYINGNRRSLDVFHAWVQGLKASAPRGYSTREGMSALAEMVEAYRLTWDPALIKLIDNFSQAILYNKDPIGSVPGGKSHWVFHPFLLQRYHGLTGNKKILDIYRELASDPKFIHQGRGGVHLSLGYLAQVDNNPKYLEMFPSLYFANSIAYIDDPGSIYDGHTSTTWIQYIYRGHSYPYVLKAMKKFGLRPELQQSITPSVMPAKDKQSLIAVQEEHDRDFHIYLRNNIPNKRNLKIVVYRLDGKKCLEWEGSINETTNLEKLTVPADQVISVYFIKVQHANFWEKLYWPITDLKKEVFISNLEQTDLVNQAEGIRLYFHPSKMSPEEVTVIPRSKAASVLQLRDHEGEVLTKVSSNRYRLGSIGKQRTVKIPVKSDQPHSFFIVDHLSLDYFAEQPFVLALDPEKLFFIDAFQDLSFLE